MLYAFIPNLNEHIDMWHTQNTVLQTQHEITLSVRIPFFEHTSFRRVWIQNLDAIVRHYSHLRYENSRESIIERAFIWKEIILLGQ